MILVQTMKHITITTLMLILHFATPVFAITTERDQFLPKIHILGTDYVFTSNADGYSGLSQQDGTVIIPTNYRQLAYLGQGVFFAEEENKKFLLDLNGRILQRLPEWASVGRGFQSGIVNLSNVSNQIAAYDKHGRNILKGTKFRYLRNFSSERAIVEYGEWLNWWSAYIDTSGKIVIGPFLNRMLNDFSNGVAIMPVGSQVGLIDTKGHFLIPPRYDSIVVDREGRYLASKNGVSKILPVKATPDPDYSGSIDGDLWNPIYPQSLIVNHQAPQARYGSAISGEVDARLPDFQSNWREYHDRVGLFGKLLAERNLIGMSIAELNDLFGPFDTRESYAHESSEYPYKADLILHKPAGCLGNPNQTMVQLGFDRQKVLRAWCINTGSGNSNPWITENCRLLDPRAGLSLSNLVPR